MYYLLLVLLMIVAVEPANDAAARRHVCYSQKRDTGEV